MKKRFSLLLIFFIAPLLSAPSSLFSQRLVIEPDSWHAGEIGFDSVQKTTITIRNTSSLKSDVSIIPTCDCLEADPSVFTIDAKKSVRVDLVYDPVDDIGETTKLFLVRRTNGGDNPEELFYEVTATVREKETMTREPVETGQSGLTSLSSADKLIFFYTPGCSWCERFLNGELAGKDVEKINVLDPQQYGRYLEALGERGAEPRELPALAIGDQVLQGSKEIETGIDGASKEGVSNKGRFDLTLFTIFGAGLLDGINPCAFTTLIFLISALSVSGRSRKEIIFIGVLFSAGVFATYSLIGLGMLGAVRSARYFPFMAKLMDRLLFGILVLFSLLSLRDWHLVRRGRTSEVLLQLPKPLKKRIHQSIRTSIRSTNRRMTAVAAGTLSMAVAVSLFELTCTGQVYLPAIIFMVRSGMNMTSISYLLIYNTAFILPLVVVFFLVYRGVTSDYLARLFRSHSASVKLALAILFAFLACVSILM